MASPPSPPSVGMRRKGLKTLPKLPLSAFSHTGTSEQFPLAASPSTINPDQVIDAHVVAPTGDLVQWKKEAGEALEKRIGGVVLSLQGTEEADIEKTIAGLESTGDLPVLSVLVPFSLDAAPPSDMPSYVTGSKVPISLSTTFVKNGTESVAALAWALQNSRSVDIDIRSDLATNDPLWDGFEDMLTAATKPEEGKKLGSIILSNILPPPHDLTLPIVRLMKHPTYQTYQSHTAALSLFPNCYVKFLPPAWDAPTPSTPAAGASFESSQSTVSVQNELEQKDEWKRRIKMYLGPVVEAFGYERIIFGSSHSSASTAQSSAGDWYEIARESFAELGIDQEAVDAVFFNNAKKVYGQA
ncbi:hypothetical protein FIBSPDRAFT_791574 [Athelia psychrophila]|uniref:Amidohydrolase-related domain-containing protein n=1 Tax=Athelia psychrophila TaxID=1759441 RepID=A0A166HBY4_9AGAM|nr:hypothetical protein FIBSPDRAFT_791574 [Fibularhizoctonia sp. CBS 109695]